MHPSPLRTCRHQVRAHHREIPVAIIGAGPGGLAVAAELARRGIAATVFERGPQVGSSWRHHYDHLRLHTARSLSRLPGMRIPRRFGRWVARADLVRYLEDYAQRHELDVRPNTTVERVWPAERIGGERCWRLRAGGETTTARAVVIATGLAHTPHIPDWPGLDGFSGLLLHSARYRNPDRHVGRDVLVVGGGNSGAEIATALAQHGATRVWWSVRTPPTIVPAAAGRWQRLGVLLAKAPTSAADLLTRTFARAQLPDLRGHGLPRAQEGLYARIRRDGSSPVHDRGIVEAVRKGRVQPVAAVASVDRSQVVLADGSRIRPDHVIAATGYRTGLARLVGPDVLSTPQDLPAAPELAEAPDLHFLGFTNHPAGHLHRIAAEARATAKLIARRQRHAGARTSGEPECDCAQRVSDLAG